MVRYINLLINESLLPGFMSKLMLMSLKRMKQIFLAANSRMI